MAIFAKREREDEKRVTTDHVLLLDYQIWLLVYPPFTAVVLLDLKDKEGLMTSKSGGGWTCWP